MIKLTIRDIIIPAIVLGFVVCGVYVGHRFTQTNLQTQFSLELKNAKLEMRADAAEGVVQAGKRAVDMMNRPDAPVGEQKEAAEDLQDAYQVYDIIDRVVSRQ